MREGAVSVKITSGVWGFRGLSDMSIGDKMTLLALADYADHDGVCYPSINQLRQKSGLSRKRSPPRTASAQTSKKSGYPI